MALKHPRSLEMKNGQEIGREHVETFKAFLASGAQLPIGSDGTLNITALAIITGIPKSSFYQNKAIRGLVEGVDRPIAKRLEQPTAGGELAAQVLAGETQADKKVQRLERRVHGLEQ